MNTQLKTELENIKKHISNTIYFKGASKAKIDFTNAMLNNLNITEIPTEYQELLTLTNGTIINLYKLYGIEDTENNNNKIINNIFEINKEFKLINHPSINNCLIIGEILSNIITYDKNEQNYKIVNNITFKEIFSFKSILDLIKHIKTEILNK